MHNTSPENMRSLKVQRLTEFDYMFSERAKGALSIPAYSTHHLILGRIVSKCIYISTKVHDPAHRAVAAQAVANVANELAAEYKLAGTLAPLSSLVVHCGELPRVNDYYDEVIYLFVHVPIEHYDQVKTRFPRLVVAEGCLGDHFVPDDHTA